MSEGLAESFDALLDVLRHRAAWLREHPFAQDEEQRPGAYSYLINSLIAGLEEDVIHDPDFPTFRVVDPRTRGGGDNADQRYLIARVNGGDTYRIWGRLGAERRLEFQVYAGDPYVSGGSGRSAGFLTHEDLEVDGDGRFEVIASPERQEGNWLENPQDGTRLLVRQTYGTWDHAAMGDMHIDRVGHEGDTKPLLTAAALEARLRQATARLDGHVGLWPDMVNGFFVESRPANELSKPINPGAVGGVDGRFMVFGIWDLTDDEALVVQTWPMDGNYQGIQLTDLWWSSLEYANRQTSLTGDQAEPSDDGSYTFVISANDPGAANWLDTMGLRRGVIMLRFDGMSTPDFDPTRAPVARAMGLAEVRDGLAGVPTVDPSHRSRAIESRRRHVQLRFGN